MYWNSIGIHQYCSGYMQTNIDFVNTFESPQAIDIIAKPLSIARSRPDVSNQWSITLANDEESHVCIYGGLSSCRHCNLVDIVTSRYFVTVWSLGVLLSDLHHDCFHFTVFLHSVFTSVKQAIVYICPFN